jgi:hypothetical protein
VLQAGGSFPRLYLIWADQGYTGTLVHWAEQEVFIYLVGIRLLLVRLAQR